MKKAWASELEEESGEGINISPLIDIVFILLLFFIVTSVFVQETGVEIERPESSQAVELDRESIYIAVSGDLKVYYGGAEIGLQGILPTLERINPADDQPVIIQVDGRVPTNFLVQVIDEVKQAGIETVNVATIEPS
ncbi:MAG: biopolymer transporter ExbD [Verrucomicrobia bacterium]|nr:biopolymer transporter ExbD [Verrucomicrobiota bacterium]